jgi:hypothetical protein
VAKCHRQKGNPGLDWNDGKTAPGRLNFNTMKLSQDFTIAGLVRGSFLGVLGLTLTWCGYYIGINGGDQTLCGFTLLAGMVIAPLGLWMFTKNFEHR